MKNEMLLIVSFNGRISQTIARMVRELGVYTEVIPYNASIDKIKAAGPRGVIITTSQNQGLDERLDFIKKEISEIDIPFLEIAAPDNNFLRSFIHDTCKCSGGWDMKSFVAQSIRNIKEKVGDKKVLCALSGGVDSSVCAVLVNEAIGKQLTCIFVDHGLLRKYEVEQVEKLFREKYDINLVKIDATDRFLGKLDGVTDPEKKRKIIGEEFIRVFEEEAKKIGAIDYLVQGTIYPDIIESGTENTGMVKSHHNVGGLPENIEFNEILEPLKYLFKDEVRKAGLELGIPESIVWRQPFPGPGLGVRVIGEITKEKLDILRDADYIFREEIAASGLDKEINQYFAVITDMRSVGVKEGKRTYDYTVALRAVKTTDFMTAEWVRIPYEILGKVSERIVNEVGHINRVVYDITGKPPATIEWE
ncbi:MAG TPA: glutamine-hydrolyzing GMP synthase [Clostridiales bacterium]|nr:glutamine-hydrolyzing GMP synthase [Clostridiales bacterium]